MKASPSIGGRAKPYPKERLAPPADFCNLHQHAGTPTKCLTLAQTGMAEASPHPPTLLPPRIRTRRTRSGREIRGVSEPRRKPKDRTAPTEAGYVKPEGCVNGESTSGRVERRRGGKPVPYSKIHPSSFCRPHAREGRSETFFVSERTKTLAPAPTSRKGGVSARIKALWVVGWWVGRVDGTTPTTHPGPPSHSERSGKRKAKRLGLQTFHRNLDGFCRKPESVARTRVMSTSP